jgi:hypothetical protein
MGGKQPIPCSTVSRFPFFLRSLAEDNPDPPRPFPEHPPPLGVASLAFRGFGLTLAFQAVCRPLLCCCVRSLLRPGRALLRRHSLQTALPADLAALAAQCAHHLRDQFLAQHLPILTALDRQAIFRLHLKRNRCKIRVVSYVRFVEGSIHKTSGAQHEFRHGNNDHSNSDRGGRGSLDVSRPGPGVHSGVKSGQYSARLQG